MNTAISELKTKGFVVVDYPGDLRLAVDRAVDSWKEFCTLPIGVKKIVSGYESKDGIGHKMDRKEKVDVSYVVAADNRENQTVRNFLRSATSLFGVLKPTVMDFARQSEAAFDLPEFADEVEKSIYRSSIRFINYPDNRAFGEEIAWAHADQSGFTLHLYESLPGLQCLTLDRKWINMTVSDGETVIIPGMQMQLRSRAELKALCHRVVATPESAERGRYSAVCFVPLENTPKIDGNIVGRLQERIPGFNYDLSHAEFSRFFKS